MGIALDYCTTTQLAIIAVGLHFTFLRLMYVLLLLLLLYLLFHSPHKVTHTAVTDQMAQ